MASFFLQIWNLTFSSAEGPTYSNFAFLPLESDSRRPVASGQPVPEDCLYGMYHMEKNPDTEYFEYFHGGGPLIIYIYITCHHESWKTHHESSLEITSMNDHFYLQCIYRHLWCFTTFCQHALFVCCSLCRLSEGVSGMSEVLSKDTRQFGVCIIENLWTLDVCFHVSSNL